MGSRTGTVWIGSPTRLALSGLMACQLPGERSLGDWSAVLRAYSRPAPEDADERSTGTGKQRDVFALGHLVYEILTGAASLGEGEIGVNDLPPMLPDLAAWFRRATARSATSRFLDAREMADEFSFVVEQAGTARVDQTLIDRFETKDVPYVVWPMVRSLHQSERAHAYVARTAAGEEVVVKVWLGMRRGTGTSVDLGLWRLFDGVSRLKASPVDGLPAYLQAGLSPAGPFVVYRYDTGSMLADAGELGAENCVSVAERLIVCVDALHSMGCAHGDIAPKNILLRASDGGTQLLDLFDLVEVGDGRVRTPDFCPEGWENLTEQQIDRFSVLAICRRLLEGAGDVRLGPAVDALRKELERPVIETLEPGLLALRDAAARLRGPTRPRLRSPRKVASLRAFMLTLSTGDRRGLPL